MKTTHLLAGIAAFVILANTVRGQFVPGHVFVSDPASDFCFHGGELYWDRIWEIDPETGEVTLFAEFFGAECRFITGLVFTPDGCHLRASGAVTDEILEFDSDGTWAVVLNAADGISGPWGSNNLAYDADGDFYVVNAGRNIMRFPADGGSGIVFADNRDGVRGEGPIAIAADGDLYFGNRELERYVLRVTPQGEASLFDTYPIINIPGTVTADDAGHVYVGLGWDGGGIHRYDAGDSESKELVASSALLRNHYAMCMGPRHKHIYVASLDVKQLLLVDVLDGSITTLADITQGNDPAGGIAVVSLMPGDIDRDRDADLDDFRLFPDCVSGPGPVPDPDLAVECQRADLDADHDVDLGDFALLQLGFGTTLSGCP